MVDFFMISTRSAKKGTTEVFPLFIIKKSKDLMIRGGDFYAIWLEDKGLWSTDEDDVINLIDRELDKYVSENRSKFGDDVVKILYMKYADTGIADKWHKYCRQQMRDNFHNLDETLVFSNTEPSKENYASKKLSYPLEECSITGYEKIISTLYEPKERHKIEWSIGAIVSGDSKKLQKFLVLYGSAGTGKSTILNIIEKLFEGYCAAFDSKALGNANSSFALEPFKNNPLVAIQHDGDLSRIEDNTRINSLVSHEKMTVNNKFEKLYVTDFKAFLIMATNKPVKITDAKSGILRRLIDVKPSGNLLKQKEYMKAMDMVRFELGGIAKHCLGVYLENPYFYDSYVPLDMMGVTNSFYNFVADSYMTFSKEGSVSLKQAWTMYKSYVEDTKIQYPLSQMAFKEELKNYFVTFDERGYAGDGERIRNVYIGFRTDIFDKDHDGGDEELDPPTFMIDFRYQPSIFDDVCKDCYAQLATEDEIPSMKWEKVKTKLKSIDTSQLHYVKVPENHIVIDFDIPDEEGNKSYERNLEAASKWPPTYAELSKSGAGIHLHYIYTGDTSKLSRIYSEHIEVKVFSGGSSLRRKLTKCNDLPIATISSGLPTKGEKVVNVDSVKSEKGLRTLILRNLEKEIHPGTKPSCDFIKKILDDAYDSKLHYDVSDMRPAVFAFAANSTHQSEYCMSLVNEMKFQSEDISEAIDNEEADIVFFDVEIFPNLYVICWGDLDVYEDIITRYEWDWNAAWEELKDATHAMIQPTPLDVEGLLKFRLVGFNNKRYDNHTLYARLMGYNNEQLFKLSTRLINSKKNEHPQFNEAYNISYTDIWDYAANKQGLKKWEIQLGIHHQELGLPWDQPVTEDLWERVADYCKNDVVATYAVWITTQGDFTARQILADLADGDVNMSTNTLTTKIIFGNDRHPELVYTDLATGDSTDGSHHDYNAFPGYEFKDGKNIYMGEDVGFGGWNYSKPGMYSNVKTFDVSGEHPASIIQLNAFGEHTKKFKELVDLRLAIKHKDYDTAKRMMDGRVAKYLTDDSAAKALSKALKIAVNSCYGLTAANFNHVMRDPRNVNNIVALRGALFMMTLKSKVEEMGYEAISVKTDSIKIVKPDAKIEKYIFEFGEKYGYQFEVENIFEKICLVNTSTFIAKCADDDPDPDMRGKWYAKAEQFQVPYVFKKLFSKEPIEFKDKCEVFSVKEGDIYIDMNEGLPDVTEYEKELKKLKSQYKKGEINDTTFEKEYARLEPLINEGHALNFVGRVGQFTPIKEGCGGGVLYRIKDGERYAVQGTKGYRWLESEVVKQLGKESEIDESYYTKLVDDAIDTINKYGDFELFVSDLPFMPYVPDDFMNKPLVVPPGVTEIPLS